MRARARRCRSCAARPTCGPASRCPVRWSAPPCRPREDGKAFAIKLGKLRGVESQGMLCSARELALSQDHEGLLVLGDEAEVGRNIREQLSLDDTLFTLKLTPNLAHWAERLRHRTRSVGADGRAAEDSGISARGGLARRCAAGEGGSPGPVRAILWSHRPRREYAGAHAGVDGRPPGALRATQRERAGRHLQLCDVRVRPALAHLRPRQDPSRTHGALGACWRIARTAQRHHHHTGREGGRDCRRCGGRVAGRHHGRCGHCGVRCHAQRLCGSRLLVAGSCRWALPALQLLDGRGPPLRAWRGSGADGGAHRADHSPHHRHLRRQCRADGRPGARTCPKPSP